METIEFEGQLFPKFQSVGNASQFAIPYAQHLLSGRGYDIGCARLDWAFPGAIPIDLEFDDPWDANHLPTESPVDFIFSSHCLEHIPDWVGTLDYWYAQLRVGGTLFLYLPDFSQRYWRPWNNRKHLHVFTPEILQAYLEAKGYKKIFVSGVDLNCSFIAVAEK